MLATVSYITLTELSAGYFLGRLNLAAQIGEEPPLNSIAMLWHQGNIEEIWLDPWGLGATIDELRNY